MPYSVGDHLISDTALDHAVFPSGFHVRCLKCEKIMLNHDILRTDCIENVPSQITLEKEKE